MPSPSAAKPVSRPLLWALAIGLIAFCLQMVDVSTYPTFDTDSAFLNDPGLQLVLHGGLRNDVLSANQGFNGPYFWQPPGLALLAALSYKLFGFGIWQTRLASILFAAGACAALYALIERLTNRPRVALAAATVVLVWPDFMHTAKTARMDTAAIFFLLMATIFVLSALDEEKSRWAALAAGLCIGFAGVFHTASVTWAIGLVGGATILLRKEPAKIVLMIGAAAILPAAWIVDGLLHFASFQQQFLLHAAQRGAEGGLLQRIAEETLRHVDTLKRLPMVLPVLVLLGVLAVRARPATPAFRLVALMTIGTIAANTLISGKHFGFYQVFPSFCLLIVGAALWGYALDQGMTFRLRLIGLALYCLMVLNMAVVAYLPRAVALAAQSRQRDYALQYRELTSRLKPGDQVWGTAVAWPAVVQAGGRLDAEPEPVPLQWTTKPAPAKHRFVVNPKGRSFDTAGFHKLGDFGDALPVILGSTYSHQDYRYELWASDTLEPTTK